MTINNGLKQQNNSERIIIYGAGELGRRTCACLKERNMQIVAFLDKKVMGKIDETLVLSPYDEFLTLEERAIDVVIICINAGNDHRQIADELYANGYKKIVFLPLNYAMPYDTKIQLTQLYNKALSGEFIWSDVREYDEYIEREWCEDAVIREHGEWVWVWMNHEILFSEDYFNWKGDKEKILLVNDGKDVNLNAYYWYHELFDYIDGIKQDCQNYLSIFAIQQNTKKGIDKICDREKLVIDLNLKLSYGLEFFVEAASEVSWNSKGYCNLVGGHHRTIFLQHKGYVYYPVKMQKKDYIIWKNHDCLEDVINYIEKCNIENTYAPVPHPYFINFPHLRENWGPTILGDILRYIGPIRLEGKKIIDVSQYEGYFARVARRMCAEKIQFYCDTEKILYLAKKLFKLLHINNIETKKDINVLSKECEDADIIFSMLNTEDIVKKGLLRNFKGKLFSEFCTEYKGYVDMVINHTEMKQYQSLHREVFDGKLLEVGVFEP